LSSRGLILSAVLLAPLGVPATAAAKKPARPPSHGHHHAAAPAPLTLASRTASDGTVYTLTVDRALTRKQAAFAFAVQPPAGLGNATITPGDLKLADSVHTLRAASSAACGLPGATAVYGTVARGARRVVATLKGGKHVRLHRRHAPRAWSYDGWIVSAIALTREPVQSISTYGRGNRLLVRATFVNPAGC
jgi:hypothetical protein